MGDHCGTQFFGNVVQKRNLSHSWPPVTTNSPCSSAELSITKRLLGSFSSLVFFFFLIYCIPLESIRKYCWLPLNIYLEWCSNLVVLNLGCTLESSWGQMEFKKVKFLSQIPDQFNEKCVCVCVGEALVSVSIFKASQMIPECSQGWRLQSVLHKAARLILLVCQIIFLFCSKSLNDSLLHLK